MAKRAYKTKEQATKSLASNECIVFNGFIKDYPYLVEEKERDVKL